MLSIVARIATVVVMAGSVAGCITSEYDVSQRVNPEFPVSDGHYVGNTPGSAAFRLTRSGNAYYVTSTSSDGEQRYSYVRFFRIPGYEYHITQYWEGALSQQGSLLYIYGYARIQADEITTFTVDYKELPVDLQHISKQEFVGVSIPNAQRDTLHFLQEVIRRGIKLEQFDSMRGQ